MPNTRILAGRLFNVVARAAAVNGLTVTDENGLYLRTGLYDYMCSVPFRFNTAGATMRLDIDANLIPNGGFETAFVGGLPAAAVTSNGVAIATWAKTAGATLTRNTVSPNVGAGCLSVAGTAGIDYAYVDLVVPSGEQWSFNVAGRKQGAAGNAIVRVQNLHTRNWLKSDGTWQAAQQDVLNNGTTLYTTTLQLVTIVEAATGTMPREMTLRVYFYAGGTAGNEALYDECYCWPNNPDLVSVHGHNVSQGVTVQLMGGTAAAPANIRATLTPRRPSFYGTVTPVGTERFYGLKFSTADLNPDGAIWLGEWVLGQSLLLTHSVVSPIPTSYIDPQLRTGTNAGQQRAFLLSSMYRRRVTLNFNMDSAAEFQEARDRLFAMTRNGAYPCMIIPKDFDAEACLYGHLAPDIAPEEAFLNYNTLSLTLDEDALPTFVA